MSHDRHGKNSLTEIPKGRACLGFFVLLYYNHVLKEEHKTPLIGCFLFYSILSVRVKLSRGYCFTT